MRPGDYEHVARVELPQIDKGERQFIGKNDACWRAASGNVTEYAAFCAHRGCSPRAPMSVR